MANSGDPAAMAEGKFPASALGRHQQDHSNDLLKGTPKILDNRQKNADGFYRGKQHLLCGNLSHVRLAPEWAHLHNHHVH